jgi:hypothetical protein
MIMDDNYIFFDKHVKGKHDKTIFSLIFIKSYKYAPS